MENESGRSMVEMLGVLAIIGVLSVGGVAGYKTALNKYRANEVAQAVSGMKVELMSAGAQGMQAKIDMDDLTTQLGNSAEVALKDHETYKNAYIFIDFKENTDLCEQFKNMFANDSDYAVNGSCEAEALKNKLCIVPKNASGKLVYNNSAMSVVASTIGVGVCLS